MVAYSYYAVSAKGKEKRGTVEADTKQQAKEILEAKDLMVVTITEATLMDKDIRLLLKKRARSRDYSVFCRQFVSMINAGVTIIDSLEMLSESTTHKNLAEGIKQVALSMKKGESFSEAMAKQEVFPEMMVKMVEAGENSGSINESFERLAMQYEKDAKLDGLIKKASIYPIIVTLVSVIVLVVMLVKVIPSYMDMFEQMGTDLPGITKAVVAASNFVVKDWYFLVAGVGIIFMGCSYFASTKKGKYFFSRLALKLPVFGKLNVKTNCSRIARNLSTLLAAGMPIIEALSMVESIVKNQLFKDTIRDARSEVEQGKPVSGAFKRSELFPPMVCHMLEIGEETGDMDGMMNKLADYCDEEVEMATQSVMAAIEPMIIMVLAVFVCILIAAIMSPMMALYSSLGEM